MHRLKFKCTFKSDVVLNAQTATEGVQSSLDYIPGANFYGMLAGMLYNDAETNKTTPEDVFDIIHSANVRFGDATIADNGIACLKMPSSLFYIKGYEITDDLYLHHKIKPEDRKFLINNNKQLKQVRSGYFNPETSKLQKIEKTFSLKSAHNREIRSSEDSKMYGYEAIKSGTEWMFFVDCDKQEYCNTVKRIVGERRLGRSKTAQYGWVEIEFVDQDVIENKNKVKGETVAIYAKSDLAFFDKYGRPTFCPTPEEMNLPQGVTIDWANSQIRTRVYAPWNFIRKNRDADRYVIEKASVIIVNVKKEIDCSIFDKGLGYFRNEGLGQVIINPSFFENTGDRGILKKPFIKADDFIPKLEFVVQTHESDSILNNFLSTNRSIKTNQENILSCISSFMAHNSRYYPKKDITSSQWGGIRDCALTSINKEDLLVKLFKPVDTRAEEVLSKDRSDSGFLMHGVAMDAWAQKGRSEILEYAINNHFSDYGTIEEDYVCDCVEKLAAMMQKQN